MWVTSVESQGKEKAEDMNPKRDIFGFGLRRNTPTLIASSEFLEIFKEIGTTLCQTPFIRKGLLRVVIGIKI